MIDLPGDSSDYHLITEGIRLSAATPGATCEIGLRRGGGTKAIIDALAATVPKVHIAIDPYGSILYEHKEADFVRLDYTNDMRDECMANLYPYAKAMKIPFIFMNLEDTEFFKRYSDGVPVYSHEKQIVNQYSFVHLDGPHAHLPLIHEIDFFAPRLGKGGCIVFDDVTGYYDHDKIEAYIFNLGFKLITKTFHKALYQL